MPTEPAEATPADIVAVRAKALPNHPPAPRAIPDIVPARMLNEVLYCERLLYLEWVQGEFADNGFTVEGRTVHNRVDQPGGKLPPPPSQEGLLARERTTGAPIDEDRPYEARTLWLTSERLGITAKVDVVEATADGSVVPIEYKRGQAPEIPEGAWLPERAQVCAQVLVLREHGYRCEVGEIYFAGSRRRVTIAITAELIATTIAAVARARVLTTAAVLPPPLVDSPKCNGCSLVGICLPDEINLLQRADSVPAGSAVAPQAGNATVVALEDNEAEGSPSAIRRLHPRNDDQLPLYVQDQGARITVDADCLVIQGRKLPREVVRLFNTSHVALYGNIQVTAQALRALLEHNIPVSFLSYGGWYYGRATGCDSKNVELRVAQHRAAADRQFCLRIARGLVASKIRNCRTLLRRHHAAPPAVPLFELEQLARKAEEAEALEYSASREPPRGPTMGSSPECSRETVHSPGRSI